MDWRLDELQVQPARVPTLTEVLDAAAPEAPAEPLPVLVEPIATPSDDAESMSIPTRDPAPDAQAVCDELARHLAPQIEALVEARLRVAAAQVAQALLEHARPALADEVRVRVAAAVREALARSGIDPDRPAAT